MNNDRLCKLIDGVTMGSPLGPTLANFFLGHIAELFNNSTVHKPKLYLRYIDGIFAVFDDDQICERFLSVLKS